MPSLRSARQYLSNLSLTTMTVVLSLVLGALLTLLVDYYQNLEFRKVFHEQLRQELGLQAQHDRAAFDGQIQQLRHLGRLITSHDHFTNYLRNPEWQLPPLKGVRRFSRPPPWLPESSLLRAYFNGRFALLLDGEGTVREIYFHGPASPLPPELLAPGDLLQKLSHNQAYLTAISGVPYVIATHPYRNSDGTQRASVMLASPIDSRFLAATHRGDDTSHIVALIDLSSRRIISSSAQETLADGTPLDALQGRYEMIGKSFFDYGSSDLQLQFTSFISTARADQLAQTILNKSRQQRYTLMAVLSGSFILLIMWVVYRLRRLRRGVDELSQQVLGIKQGPPAHGDEITVLERHFARLSEEIVSARERLSRETEEKIALAGRAMEGQKRAQELFSLQSVTETLAVGIILDSPEGPLAFNPLMERFSGECGGLSPFFLTEGCASRQLQLLDNRGNRRHFEVNRHAALGRNGYLVREITAQVQAEEERNLFEKFPACNPNPILRINRKGEILYANEASKGLLGMLQLEQAGTLQRMLQQKMQAIISSDFSQHLELSVGQQHYAFVPAQIEGSDFFYLYGQDITERRRAEREQQLSAAVTRNVLDAILVTDVDGVIRSVNPAFSHITGYQPEEAIGHTPAILRSKRHDKAFYEQMWQALQRNGKWEGEIWNRRKDGEIFPCYSRISSIRNEDGTIDNFIAVFTDISVRKEQEERLARLAYHDGLTRLPNRILFMDRLEQAINMAERNREQLAVMFLDLDGFKQVNDRFGHDIGDLLLQEVARRLLECVRDSDTVSRLAGDEFAIILQGVHDLPTVNGVANKVLTALHRPFDLHAHHAQVSASIGIALYPDDGTHAAGLLKRADEAMYAVKHAGKNDFRYLSTR